MNVSAMLGSPTKGIQESFLYAKLANLELTKGTLDPLYVTNARQTASSLWLGLEIAPPVHLDQLRQRAPSNAQIVYVILDRLWMTIQHARCVSLGNRRAPARMAHTCVKIASKESGSRLLDSGIALRAVFILHVVLVQWRWERVCVLAGTVEII
jgi:hypothetical protein